MTRGSKKRGRFAALLIIICAIVALGAAIVSRFTAPHEIEYVNEITRYAGEYDLDPYLVAAVINTESNFDPDAVSHAGALGLMQIMPETGEWIAGKLGIQDFNKEMLLEPEINIRFGTWYLHFLNERFGGDPTLIAAAYNAGHGRVADWLQDADFSDPEGNLVHIPYEETSSYVEKIAKTQEEYRRKYPEKF